VDLDAFFAAQLQALEADKLRRALPAEYGPLLSFASNDYLGLSRHPALVEAARRATAEHGVGAGASRLLATDNAVVALEAVLAEWKEKEAALVFSSGYAAALGNHPRAGRPR
jgi:7-keto-8-aminopelargonate synthetase-like enzyme